ncbi:flagellar hook-basal body complex protein FliE [Brevibacillus fulvus]|uniref:Flagellar hook-basal body complex protein FliE n=1 Tax=Brevibacillus fulvus TaxID=1125967 RepID=A0A938XZN7_9BACL|nr:flagellar hook-basal body complex protein FliE [Brevibacillus fulvus]MBM7590630.1 flagellar hook-basal body complex protein FliE [Brevibacillus fulvus]
MEVNSLLQTNFIPAKAPAVSPTPAEVAKSFSSYLTDALDQVNQAQVDSAKLNDQFAAGQIEDIHQVMVASQKSSLLLSLTVQMRNKAIESYQEIMRMSL